MSQPQEVHHIPPTWYTASRVSAPSGIGAGSSGGLEIKPSRKLCWNNSVSRKFCPEATTPLSRRMA